MAGSVQGDAITVHLFEPLNSIGKSEIKISNILHTYKSTSEQLGYGNNE